MLGDGRRCAPVHAGTHVPPASKSGAGAPPPGQFTTIVGTSSRRCKGALCPARLQTWVDGPGGLVVTANASVTFIGTPAAFLASGCNGVTDPAGSGCWLSSPSQTILRTGDGNLLLSMYGYALDSKPLCAGGKRCYSTAFYTSNDNGLTWTYASRVDATANMTAVDKHGGRSSPDIVGPSQASMALLEDGRVMAAFRLIGDGATSTSNTSNIMPIWVGGNLGINIWVAYVTSGSRA